MKNITLSAQDEVIDELRRVAKSNTTTVNDLFRIWAEGYLAKQRSQRLKAFEDSVRRVNYVKLDRKYTREEMNER